MLWGLGKLFGIQVSESKRGQKLTLTGCYALSVPVLTLVEAVGIVEWSHIQFYRSVMKKSGKKKAVLANKNKTANRRDVSLVEQAFGPTPPAVLKLFLPHPANTQYEPSKRPSGRRSPGR